MSKGIIVVGGTEEEHYNLLAKTDFILSSTYTLKKMTFIIN